jgi:hypothetical protein
MSTASATAGAPPGAFAAPGLLTRAAPGLLYGIRLWASVCLAMFVAFRLELESPFWAATSAAIVCQPSLGASLRKGGFRMIGTVIGATAIVLMTAAFPQSRIGFLAILALWIGLCGFTAAILRNFAGYAAALSGYTAAIIFADSSSDPTATFMLAVTRASEICLGIVCAGVVLAGTDFGTARQRLAAKIAGILHEAPTAWPKPWPRSRPTMRTCGTNAARWCWKRPRWTRSSTRRSAKPRICAPGPARCNARSTACCRPCRAGARSPITG